MDQAAPATLSPPAAEEIAERGPALLRPLRDRDFRLIFGGETISVLGDQFHFVALAWLALQLTGSGLALGSVLMTAAIPRAVFVLVGGAFSDRFSPRTLMLVSNVIRGRPNSSPLRRKLICTVICMPGRAWSSGGGTQHARSADPSSPRVLSGACAAAPVARPTIANAAPTA